MLDAEALARVERRRARVPMSDGVTLSADLYLPHADAFTDGIRRPVVFDYYPYRKDDLMAGRVRAQRYFAARGMVGARVDVRGTGSSAGIATDEYSEHELSDGEQVIGWFAAQPWCNGNVGMFGSSYGGFNSIQVAMRRPPALKAICPMYFTDNRYTDDCHYKGGSLQMLFDLASYGLSMVPSNALPPSPDAAGEDWARITEERLANPPWLLNWIEHQVYDAYWRHGSLSEDYASIQAATYLFGGWRDGYVTCNLRTFEHLRCPKKLIIGPWGHIWPDVGVPGPRIDHLHEHARFFEHWLMGIDNGVMDEPPITLYVQRYDRPLGRREHTSGYWRHEAGWPLDRAHEQVLHLAPAGALTSTPSRTGVTVEYDYDPTVGMTFGIFGGSSALPLVPPDQRLEAGLSTTWTTEPLDATVEILGRPRLELRITTSAEIATVVARLIDVAPDGRGASVTKGILNLTHRDSHEAPARLEPGRAYDVAIDLETTSWVFEPGHRIQVAVTGADYPFLWPSPLPYVAAVDVGRDAPSRLRLPVVGALDPALPGPTFAPVAPLDEAPSFALELPAWRITRDLSTGGDEVTTRTHSVVRLADGGTARTRSEGTTSVRQDDPAHASIHGTSEMVLDSPERVVRAAATGRMRSDATTFHLSIDLEVSVDGRLTHARQWRRSVPRHLL